VEMGEKAKLPRADGKLVLREEGRVKVWKTWKNYQLSRVAVDN